ncbi:MAG TPA: Holliday junction branch migration protein RuvA [Anaerolineaceae bacterium]|nr:Holliday junction branch migration protein RuvA [Anaerolineaceae bacterium]
MIASLKGIVTFKNDHSLVVETGGIGFKISCTKATCAQAEVGNHISLYTHHITREDGMFLYGFEKIEERDLFIQILSVSGIGPKLGLNLLSSLSAEAIQRAVMKEQDEVFSHVPGIGEKTAKKIVLMLKDKIAPLLEEAGLEEIPDTDTDVLQALVGLGYSLYEAQKAVASIPRDAPQTPEERLRLALQYFSA